MTTKKTNGDKSNTADRTREIAVYKYLLSFTDLGLDEDDTINKLLEVGADKLDPRKLPNESLITNQWSYKDKNTVGINRTYVRRVLRCVYGRSLYKENEEAPWSWPSLSMAKLVFILSSLEAYWNDKPSLDYRKKLSKVTHSVKSKALQIFSELSFEERGLLNIPVRSGEGLIRKLYEDILNPSYAFGYEELIRIYEQFLESKTVYYPESTDQSINSIIDGHISDFTSSTLSEEESNKLRGRILGEINRIEFQSGAEQLKNISSSFDKNTQITSIRKKMFVRNLTKCIIENEGMTREFPIGIKFFEVEKIRPLPLSIYNRQDNEIGLINLKLLEKNTEISGLERQYSYKVGLHFSVRGDQGESPIDFFEEITGIGSPISHAMIAMDRVLMWDIPCLKEYFPIARKQFSNDVMIGGNQNSAVWTHCVVQLYTKAEVSAALNNEKSLEEVVNPPISHHGEYCGFDAFEVSIKAAFLARLRAIKHVLKENNINSSEYIKQLRYRVKEYASLCEAKNMLQFYPFSLVVMKAKINSNIFLNCTKYRARNEEQSFYEIEPGNRWSSVAYDAHLKITEALIKEGRTVQVKKYLNILDTQTKYLSTLMLARYYICYSQYHFLSDLDSIDNDNPDRATAISESEKYLKLAEDSLKKKLQECELLKELSHSNTHPFFELYSKISLTRARLYLYFISYAKPKDNSIWGRAKAPLIEAEKARMYSARDGNVSLYFSQSCFQAWTYLILAFTWDFEKEPKDKEGFSKKDCVNWASRLLKHATICYEDIGVKCYSDIKRNAGFLAMNRFGTNIKLDGIPFIQEIAPNQERNNQEIKGILDLNLDLFKTNKVNLKKEDAKRPIFFGSDSSNIMFTNGMIELCDLEAGSNLLPNILSAMRKFVIAWSTSRDGALCEEVDGMYHIREIFQEPLKDKYNKEIKTETKVDSDLLEKIDKNNDRYIRGFYPHRISKIAVFSKLFIGSCLLILKCKEEEISSSEFNKISWSEISWEEIREFAKGLHEKDVPEIPLIQERFNGHLADHTNRIVQYFEGFEDWSKSPQGKDLNIIQVRDKVVKDTFLLVRGEAIKP